MTPAWIAYFGIVAMFVVPVGIILWKGKDSE